MAKLSDAQIWQATSDVKRVKRIDEAVRQLPETLTQLLSNNLVNNRCEVSVVRQTDLDPDFGFALRTIHGEVQATYDHVLCDNALLGHLTFWTMRTGLVGNPVRRKIWAILTNEEHVASFSEDGDMEWYFGPKLNFSAEGAEKFLMAITAYAAASLDCIGRT